MLAVQSKEKTDCNAKILEIGNKYITLTDCNKFTKNIVFNQIKTKNLINKSDIYGLLKNG